MRWSIVVFVCVWAILVVGYAEAELESSEVILAVIMSLVCVTDIIASCRRKDWSRP